MRMLLPGLALVLATTLLSGYPSTSTAAPPKNATDNRGLAVATFAGGCFWCVESGFEHVPGVVTATSGYTGGHTQDPTYEQVSGGTTGHREAVEVRYDPEVVSYEGLLQAFWRMVDPTDAGGQFPDRGTQYTTAIWYHTQAQRAAAERSKTELDAGARHQEPIMTPILPAESFYVAEDKHQDYYKRHSAKYKFYRYLSGRDDYLEETWGPELQVDFSKIR